MIALAFAGPLAIAEPDSRKLVQQSSPDWLAAVGKLIVPATRVVEGRRRHYREDCSATLVAAPDSPQADIIVTAWHCLEFYNDLSKPIVFTLRYGEAGARPLHARRMADGGGMHADWAILQLAATVSREDVAAVPVTSEAPVPGRGLILAGYSRDPGLGALGERLTYDEDCQLITWRETVAETDCQAHQGSSGGAVVTDSGATGYRLLGVVSEGDGYRLSTFVPTMSFHTSLNRYLAH